MFRCGREATAQPGDRPDAARGAISFAVEVRRTVHVAAHGKLKTGGMTPITRYGAASSVMADPIVRIGAEKPLPKAVTHTTTGLSVR